MHPDRADLGLVLRLLRRRQQLSQHQLAVNSGLQQRQISFFESGRAQPRIASLQRLAGALGLQPQEFEAVLRCATPPQQIAAADPPPLHTWRARAQAHRWPALVCDHLGHILAVNHALEQTADRAGITIAWPGKNLYALSFSSAGLLPWLEDPAQVWAATKWQALAIADYAPALLRLFAQLDAEVAGESRAPGQPSTPPSTESYRTPRGRWSFQSWNSQLGAPGSWQARYCLHLLQPLGSADAGRSAPQPQPASPA